MKENDKTIKIINKDKLDNLNIGTIFKSTNKLIEYLGIKYNRNVGEKERILDYISDYIMWESTNNKRAKNEIMIININNNMIIKPIIDKRECSIYNGILSDKEKRDEFDGYYVYAHLKNSIIMYIGKGCRKRCITFANRNYNREDIDEIKILKRFDNELEAFKYEERMISYYQSIGQCKYNDDTYHAGNIRDKDIKSNIKYEKLIEKRNKLQNKINELVDELDKINDELKNYSNSN